jgi:DNA-3-methyladenine glycosylase
VYFNYGVHWLVNAVTEPEGHPAAVLLRALDPVTGLDLMRARRATRRGEVTREWSGSDADLCRGPGNLTRALAITGTQNMSSLSDGPLRIEYAAASAARLPVAWSPRIGIRVGQDTPWRAYVPGHPSVSGRPR